ncbi:hypothetical protein FHS25_006599 [Rhizobium laguerreae]|uniref:Cytochrome c-type biogenesis protein CcmF C-terminal domain-containing protein n=1 Tax=Rhizobium laguerreae TaxID=1076926 RepID=A0ABR6GKQ8_9HYPH|nr:hypothetical protein [Rhizobium laguerreae]OOO52490.1 hypothetical protein BS630_03855 [Rhizobium laguerreae]
MWRASARWLADAVGARASGRAVDRPRCGGRSWYRAGIGKVAGSLAWRRLTGLPRSAFGTAPTHAGLGVSVLGTVAVTMFETEDDVEIKPGQVTEAGGYSCMSTACRCRRRRQLVGQAPLCVPADADDGGGAS